MDSLAQAGDRGCGSFFVVVVVSLFDGLVGRRAWNWAGDRVKALVRRGLIVWMLSIWVCGCGPRDSSDFFLGCQGTARSNYRGLANKRIALVVTTHPGIEFDHPLADENIARAANWWIRRKVRGVTFVDPYEIESFQRSSVLPIKKRLSEIAQRFDMDRLVLVELMRFTLVEEGSVDLLRGRIVSRLSVYELDRPSGEQLVYQDELRLVIPPNSPVSSSRITPLALKKLMIERFAEGLAGKF